MSTPSRRTLVKGAAWSVPVVAVSSAAPALAASPGPIIVEPRPGEACKFPGGSCNGYKQAYRFTFCFTNESDQDITVYFTNMVFADGREKQPSPASVEIPAGAEDYCVYVIADDMGNSSNGQGTLFYYYEYNGERVDGQIGTGANDLPPCEDCADLYGQAGAPIDSTTEETVTEDAPVEETTDTEQATAAPEGDN